MPFQDDQKHIERTHAKLMMSDPVAHAQRVFAEKMFETRFKLNMKGGSIEAFRRDYPTLHDKVIVPLLEDLLKIYHEANAHRDAEIMWEKLMMELVGEDGPGSVREAITALKEDRDKLRGFMSDMKHMFDRGMTIGPNTIISAAVAEYFKS